jgi:phosphatidylglycerol:prolipoprotein diacylglycerol transferase
MYPILFHSGNFIVPSYFAVISLVCSIVLVWAARRADTLHYSRNLAMDLSLVIMVFGFIGARLFHVVFEYPELYRESPARIFRFWEGGFVFYGGAVLAACAGLAFVKFKRESIPLWLDFTAPLLAFAYGAGRIGCFLAGCCFGRYCALPWGVTFPRGSEAPAGIPIHPTQLYATFWELGICCLLVFIEKKKPRGWLTKRGDLFYFWMMLHGIGRIIMEIFRADYRGEKILSMSISSVISAVIIVLGISLYLVKSKKS